MTFIDPVGRALGRLLARYLTKPIKHYVPVATTGADRLTATLVPGDVLLVEGNTRVSTAIKYLTQSTWSHAALYVGARLGSVDRHGEALSLIEADVVDGVRAVPVSKYANFHTRICRPVGLPEAEINRVLDFAIARIGQSYDLRNVWDLARYLLPTPPVPVRVRRRMIGLGSGDPTRAICSTLIAQAFQSVRYPILPLVGHRRVKGKDRNDFVEEVLRVRHYSLFTPRDFDISPYFRVVKPLVDGGFDPKKLRWADRERSLAAHGNRLHSGPNGAQVATGEA